MKTERRELEDWEKAECAALKAAIASYNLKALPDKKLTQERIAQELGMTQGNLSSHLNGKRAITKEIAARVARMIDIPVEQFSPRLAQEIADMAQAVQPPRGPAAVGERQGHYAAASRASGTEANRNYQGDMYQAAQPEHRQAVDEIADKMLSLTPEQALKLKQAMDLLMPSNEPRKD